MKKMAIGKTAKSNAITYEMVIVVFIIVQIPLVTGRVPSPMKGLLVSPCIYITTAVPLNLTVDILGELSLGHAGFTCVGTLVSSFFSVCMKDTTINAELRLFLAPLVGVAAAAMAGITVDIPVFWLRGDYLAIVTLVFDEITKNAVDVIYPDRDFARFHVSMKNSTELDTLRDGKVIINDTQGITGALNNSTLVIGFVLVLIILSIVLNLVHSRSGRAIMVTYNDRIVAESIGIGITKHKLMALTISVSLAGVAGVLYLHNLSTSTTTQKNLRYNQSIMILVLVVPGGTGSVRGSVIVAVILILLPEPLCGLNNYHMLIYTIALIAVIISNRSPAIIDSRKCHSFKQMSGKKRTAKEMQQS